MEVPLVKAATVAAPHLADNQPIAPQNRPTPPPVKDSIAQASNSSLLETAKSLLSTFSTIHDHLVRAQDWGLIILSSANKTQLKQCKRAIGFLTKLIGTIDKISSGSALKTVCIGFAKLAIAGLSIYANFFKNKGLQQLVSPLKALVGLVSEKTAVEKQVKALQKQGVSIVGLCKLFKSLSSITTKTLSLAALASGGALSLPLLIYALGIIQTGCGTVVEAHNYMADYVASFSLVGI